MIYYLLDGAARTNKWESHYHLALAVAHLEARLVLIDTSLNSHLALANGSYEKRFVTS